MRIYMYMDDNYPQDLPIESIWMEEDYPNSIMSNTPGQTLHEYEVAWDREHDLPPRHPTNEERSFVPYVSKITDNFGRTTEYKRIKFEKLYRVYYYEFDSLEEFLIRNKDKEVVYHYGYFFCWDMDGLNG